MTIWSMPPVEKNPIVHLVRWRVYRLVAGAENWDILNGWDVENACGRCSTPVMEVDVRSRMVLTRSGRRYVLEGGPGFDDDALYVFEARFGPSDGTGLARKDVTSDYQSMVAPIDTWPDQRSRAIRAISRKAEQVFGDVTKAQRWLSSANPILGSSPLSLS